MNQDLEQTKSFSSSSSSSHMRSGSAFSGVAAVPLAPPTVLIPGKHLPEPLMDMQHAIGSPMDVVPVLTTPVETPKAAEQQQLPQGDKEEKVGRWSEQEHKIFLEGLERYGKQWKTIAIMIGSRTVVQVRTHAQKYFQKMERKNKDSKNAGGGTTTPACSGSVLATTSMPKTPTGGASKRKSLSGVPSATAPPSRKKSKSPKKTTRVVSLASTTAASPPPPPLELPHFMSNVSSLENLSTVSPNGVADMDLGLVPSHSSVNTCGDVSSTMLKDSSGNVHHHYHPNMYMEVNVGDETAASAAVGLDVADLGEDPLEWLIDGGINHLPESSLEAAPMFPDFSDMSSSTDSTMHHHPHQLAPAIHVPPKSFDTSFLQEIADPKVTVQSLFLETQQQQATGAHQHHHQA